jgi:hypothetical protein
VSGLSGLNGSIQAAAGLPLDVPVDPDAPEAQRWLIEELAKSPYQSAKPSFFEQVLKQISDWINSLIDGLGSVQVPGAGNVLNLIILLGVIAVLVVAFLIFGLPRLNRRSAAAGELFGDDDIRDAAALRRDADRAAAVGDYTTAIEELFRALARNLDERTLVSFFPGSTARDVAVRAGTVFPDAAARLVEAARGFDGVRYLGATGTVEQWQRLVELERELRTARPAHEEFAEEIAVPR